MKRTVADALQAATLYTDGQDYLLIRSPLRSMNALVSALSEVGTPFLALIADKDEATLVLAAARWNQIAARFPESSLSPISYRLITLDVALDFSLVGFMAALSAALAEAGISILPYAAFTRDHLLVPAEQVATALETLRKLQANGV